MVVWSSWESFNAVATLAELATISALSSLHFCINRFSLSWDFFKALWSFSYSTRNFSKLRSPINSPRTCKTRKYSWSWQSYLHKPFRYFELVSDLNDISIYYQGIEMAYLLEVLFQCLEGTIIDRGLFFVLRLKLKFNVNSYIQCKMYTNINVLIILHV